MIKAVIVDNTYETAEKMKSLVLQNHIHVIAIFTESSSAFEFIIDHKPDIVFLNINMPEIDGISLAIMIKERLSETDVVFVSEDNKYALEAYTASPLDFLVKPVDQKRFLLTMKWIDKKFEIKKDANKPYFYIRCFGNLKFYKGDEIVSFPTQKTRDILAYIMSNVDTPIYRDELIYALFGEDSEEEKNINNLRVSLFRLRKTFEDAGLRKSDFFIKSNFSLNIKPGLCDLVDFSRFIDKNKIINESNINQATKVLERFNGELFTGIDTIWVSEKRESVIIEAEELFNKISLFYISNGNHVKAEEHLLKLIGINSFSEQGYLLLLDLYILTKNRQKYCFYFRQYERIMREELHSLPDKKYYDYFKIARS